MGSRAILDNFGEQKNLLPPPEIKPQIEYPVAKAIAVQAYYRLRGFQVVGAPRFRDNRHMKEVRSAQRTGRLYPPGNIPGTHLCWRLSRLQGHSAAGRIKSLKNSKKLNLRPSDLQRSTLTAPPRTPNSL